MLPGSLNRHKKSKCGTNRSYYRVIEASIEYGNNMAKHLIGKKENMLRLLQIMHITYSFKSR